MLKNWINLGSDTDSISANRLNPGQMLELMLQLKTGESYQPQQENTITKKILEQKSFNNRTIVRY